jgi:hypothetical protein
MTMSDDSNAIYNADKVISPGVQDPGSEDPETMERDVDACVFLLLNPDDLNAIDYPLRPAERAKAEAYAREHGLQVP